MKRADLTGADTSTARQWTSAGGATVKVGTVGDEWFAWHSRKGDAWVCVYERSISDIADQWLARGTWTEVETPGLSGGEQDRRSATRSSSTGPAVPG